MPYLIMTDGLIALLDHLISGPGTVEEAITSRRKPMVPP